MSPASSGAHADTFTTAPTPATPPSARFRLPVVVAFVVVALSVLAVAVLVGYRLAGPANPSGTSADAGFARDMQIHHN